MEQVIAIRTIKNNLVKLVTSNEFNLKSLR